MRIPTVSDPPKVLRFYFDAGALEVQRSETLTRVHGTQDVVDNLPHFLVVLITFTKFPRSLSRDAMSRISHTLDHEEVQLA